MDINYYAKEDSLRLFAWHEVNNLGDRLGPALFHFVSGRPVCIEARGLRPIFDQGEARTIHCFLGTLLQLLSGPHHFVVWGMGTAPPEGPAHHGCQPIAAGLQMDFRALRGPLTHRALTDAGYDVPPEIPYGDPALLIPYFFRPSPYQVDDFCIVPHHSHYEEVRRKFPGMNVIDMRIACYEDIQAVIAEITKYRVIFSSSLHVTILAECFGIPTQPVEPTLQFKFDDFYAACDKRIRYIPALSRELDWTRLYEETLRSWEPIHWDPEPWIDAAPFSVEPGLRQALKRHYKDLRRARVKASAMKREVLQRYSLSKIGRTSDDRSGNGSEILAGTNRSVLFEEHFKNGLGAWQIPPPDDLSGEHRTHETLEITDDGCVITRDSDKYFLASPFVKVGEMAAVEFVYELGRVDGLMEVIVQDENYETWARVLIQEGEEAGERRVSFSPVRADMALRMVFLPLRGRLLVKRVTINGESANCDSS